MNAEGRLILDRLEAVAAERRARSSDAGLASRVARVKAFQHARFSQTYADLLAHRRYGNAARFFLDDLYGPQDFTERDAQFARIVPGLVRLFPHDIVLTVAALAELHALSEALDTAMGRALLGEALDGEVYGLLWRAVGRAPERERQIALMLQVGGALDGFTRKPFLRTSLKMMRGPAAAAGLAALQRFLETGFDTFREMQGAQVFLDTDRHAGAGHLQVGTFRWRGCAPPCPAGWPAQQGHPRQAARDGLGRPPRRLGEIP